MKRIKHYVVPAIFTVLGIWLIANKTSFLKIMGIIMVAISAVGITLHVTDREEAKVPKIGYSILSGLVGAVGAFVLIAPDFATQYIRYLIGGIIVLFAGSTAYRMYRNHYNPPFVIAEGIAVVLGIVIIFVTMDESFFPVAAGCSTVFTGVAALLGQFFGRPGSDGKKILKVNTTPIPVPNGEAEPSGGNVTNPSESPAEPASTAKQAEAGLTEKTAETDSAESTVQTSPAGKRPDEASAGTEKPEEKAEKNV